MCVKSLLLSWYHCCFVLPVPCRALPSVACLEALARLHLDIYMHVINYIYGHRLNGELLILDAASQHCAIQSSHVLCIAAATANMARQIIRCVLTEGVLQPPCSGGWIRRKEASEEAKVEEAAARPGLASTICQTSLLLQLLTAPGSFRDRTDPRSRIRSPPGVACQGERPSSVSEVSEGREMDWTLWVC